MDPAKLREVLRRQGIYVAEGDPVLETAAICEAALADTIKTIEQITKAQADRITVATTQSVVDAERKAEALLNDAGDWAEERIKAAGQEAAASVLATLREQVERAEAASRLAVRAAYAAGFLALLTIAGLGGMLLATIRV